MMPDTVHPSREVAARAPDSGSGLGGRGADVLAAWAEGVGRREGMRSRGCLRFAFYGRVSTKDWQDPVTSRARQLRQAVMLIGGHGVIMTEFFDAGESRTLPWARRAEAAALVAALADPDRGWERDRDRGVRAGVLREPVRAGWRHCSSITGSSCGCRKSAGAVDWHAEDHEQTMLALGLSSKREITRIRDPGPDPAMAAQTREQGRYLGGAAAVRVPAG